MGLKHLTACLAILTMNLTAARAADAPPTVTAPLADLSAEASRSAPNDQLRALVYAEASDANAADVARRVNGLIAQALATARGYPAVKVKSAGNSTTPVYGKSGRAIDAWRMRSSLSLESGDTAALSELLGKLQQSLAVASLNAAPSPETWRKVEDEVIGDALSAFQNRARLVAGGLGRGWRIRQISVNTSGGRPQPVMPYARAAMAIAEAAPAPVEAGDTPITVTVTGQIELLDR
ncbi:MAG TPA: SIMPL domain-containing protein [Zoogloea sp.]|uniref:SIMPL domain-containing protein n=1 Tax=Zoogloea sp. TaxID=49181 RepID=UPI002BFDCCE1|nr:SIMPL domain-containing protein [Zoogloea sp.]HMZ75960.1 SIMPL domain-containing protein [Rhodocyclaceae bacterium]HNA67375.1 SIMPL domain-containing protein [Rhodocyclaceae bacterium]HNB65263.1 SIMPL domain-containing protein [Rhodocyclaceae bacterium]HND23360.1 SIMPL domain-containing protein [Rhodocyclaceae bacterium]HNH15954.1 SIMPL domain-containing protein [Zoogloea sp.]